MGEILISWIGGNDLQARPEHPEHHKGLGPLFATLKDRRFSRAHLIYNYPKKEVAPYLKWLKTQVDTEIQGEYVKLTSPTDFAEIYQAANATLKQLWQPTVGNKISILLSPGTPAMQAVWILLGKTRYPVKFIQSSTQQGVQDVNLPFDIAAEFLPELAMRSAGQLTELMANTSPDTAQFDSIISQNPTMQRLKERAAILAARDVPVLIQGETGTGKELFARAIHNSSARSKQPFIALNCGAIPKELIDSALFGHVKGAFTGATNNHKGVFEQADGGTLFLDEFGELPLDAQVRLLRVLQDGSLTRVGDSKEHKVDVRIIAATHKDLTQAIADHQFREDLYYRVAIGVLPLPPLREREGDLNLLTDNLLANINKEASTQPGYKHKNISPGARKVILNHSWAGNVRELHAALLRATLWSAGDQINEADMGESMLQTPQKQGGVMEKTLGNGFNIQELIDGIEHHYVEKAWQQSGKHKKQAADLLGYNNYQNLDKRLKKYGIE